MTAFIIIMAGMAAFVAFMVVVWRAAAAEGERKRQRDAALLDGLADRNRLPRE